MTPLQTQLALAVARHALTLAGGVLVHKGLADQSQVETAGATLLTLAGVAWSMIQKWQTQKHTSAPTPDTRHPTPDTLPPQSSIDTLHSSMR